MSCDKAPSGWRCTRQKGHDGPCAAREYTWIHKIETFGLRVIRYFHNRKRLKENERLYAFDTAEEVWSRSCHTVGDLIWTKNIKDAEPMHRSEFGGYKKGKTVDPMRLLRMEGWEDVWLYTEEEWKDWIKEQIVDAVFKDIE